MNTAAQYFMIGMESESRAIARGLRRRDPNLLDRLIEQFQHRLFRYLIYLVGNRELAQPRTSFRKPGFVYWNAAISTTANTNSAPG